MPVPELTEPEIDKIVEVYRREMTRYEEAASLVEGRLRRELRAEAVRSVLSSRAKHPDDVRDKLKKNAADPRYTYNRLAANIDQVVNDLAGVRVLTYQGDDVEKVRRIVRSSLRVASLPKSDELHDKPTGYAGAHLLIEISADEERASLRGTICEVQVTTLAAHVFNELEHDVRYKSRDGVQIGVAETKTLDDLKAASRLLDRSAERLLGEHGDSIVRSQRELTEAGDLQFVFEREAGRRLSGDFERIFRFYRSSVDKLTAASLEALSPVALLLERGNELATQAHWDDADDVSKIVMALYDSYPAELIELANRPGRPGAFKRAVETARDLKSQVKP